jgi:OOP family OmpA-OmpF porin
MPSCLLAAALVLFPAVAPAFELRLPEGARISASRSETLSSTLLPTGPWSNGVLPARRVEGALDQTAWVFRAAGLTTLEILAPLRQQLSDAGFAILWECDTANCGGFDFRYAIDVLAEPDMHVDLGDFRFLSAERPAGNGTESVSLMVSRSAADAFVQVLRVGPPGPDGDPPVPAPAAGAGPAPEWAPGTLAGASDTGRALTEQGFVVLDGLAFASGSARLQEGPFAALTELAAYLAQNPEARITLVGHTDASGDLAGNVALSRARADAVRDRLIAAHGIDAARLGAEGVGYLAPRASNLTPEGRALNRRVEAMLTVPR